MLHIDSRYVNGIWKPIVISYFPETDEIVVNSYTGSKELLSFKVEDAIDEGFDSLENHKEKHNLHSSDECDHEDCFSKEDLDRVEDHNYAGFIDNLDDIESLLEKYVDDPNEKSLNALKNGIKSVRNNYS